MALRPTQYRLCVLHEDPNAFAEANVEEAGTYENRTWVGRVNIVTAQLADPEEARQKLISELKSLASQLEDQAPIK